MRQLVLVKISLRILYIIKNFTKFTFLQQSINLDFLLYLMNSFFQAAIILLELETYFLIDTMSLESSVGAIFQQCGCVGTCSKYKLRALFYCL